MVKRSPDDEETLRTGQRESLLACGGSPLRQRDQRAARLRKPRPHQDLPLPEMPRPASFQFLTPPETAIGTPAAGLAAPTGCRTATQAASSLRPTGALDIEHD